MVGKIRKYDEERVYFQKKRVQLFKNLNKNGKAEYISVVAGRLVIFRRICNVQEKLFIQ